MDISSNPLPEPGTPEFEASSLGERLRYTRKFLGYSLSLAAECLKVPVVTLSDAELGHNDMAQQFLDEMQQW